MYNQLVVLSEPVAGREDEFNDWYSFVHIRDVMRLSRVVIAVQRFKKTDLQLTPGGSKRYPQPYLALYENTDPVRMTADHAPCFTADMPISSAYSFNNIGEAYYDTVIARTKTAGDLPKTDLIIERIERSADKTGFADWYVTMRFPALMNLTGVVSGLFGHESTHQMYEVGARPAYTAVYRTTDLAASLNAWRQYATAAHVPWKAGEADVDCYTPIIERVTAQQVADADPATRAFMQAKREAMGDRLHKGPPGSPS
jgi:hypothetical protein